MYDGPGSVLALDPVTAPHGLMAPTAPLPFQTAAGDSGQQSQRFRKRLMPQMPFAGPAASPPPQTQSLLLPAAADTSSPRRFQPGSSAAVSGSAAPGSPLGAVGGAGGGRRPVSLAVSPPSATVLSVLLPRGDLDLVDGDVGPPGEVEDISEELLPSLVPDLSSPARRLQSGRSRTASTVMSPNAVAATAASLLRDSPDGSGGGGGGGPGGGSQLGGPGARSLRASTMQLAAGSVVPHPPVALHAGGSSSPIVASPTPPSLSERLFRRLPSSRRSFLAAGGRGPSVPGEAGGEEGSSPTMLQVQVAMQAQQGALRSPGGFSGREELVVDESALRRSSLLAWGPTTDDASGARGPLPLGGRSTGSITGPSLAKQNPNLSLSVGFSRRPEDLPAAPNPAHARSLCSGSQSSTPGTPGTPGTPSNHSAAVAGRPLALFTSQPSMSAASSSAGIGISRRPEDMPAAPSPANSRSLAGGGRSGGSTPASPPHPGTRGVAVQGQWMEQGGSPRKLSVGGAAPDQPSPRSTWRIDAATGRTNSTLVGPTPTPTPPPPPTTTIHYSGEVPSLLRLNPGATTGTSTSQSSVSSPGCAPSRAPAGPHGAMPSPPAGSGPGPGSASGRSPGSFATTSQGHISVGFSRRAEDLPAAPSPSHSRSLAGTGGGSAGSSTRSPGAESTNGRWVGGALDSPRTPPSPSLAGSGAAGVGISRRPEDLPAAPPPGAARSLRPESSRTAFRSHAMGGAGGGSAVGSGGSGARLPLVGAAGWDVLPGGQQGWSQQPPQPNTSEGLRRLGSGRVAGGGASSAVAMTAHSILEDCSDEEFL